MAKAFKCNGCGERRSELERSKRGLCESCEEEVIENSEYETPMTKEAFIEYLEHTLIPDLIDSGHEATAEDFTTCVKFMKEG